jgi:predicted NUDIX family NTP pyrophosphohydrolase
MKQSAGLLLFRKTAKGILVLIVHPGGPFWAKKDAGAWSIPKGEFADGEEPLHAARREFAEELGRPAPEGELIKLGAVKQSSSKIVHAWTQEADFDAGNIRSNTVTLEWPPKSGRQQEFPEVDKAAWVSLAAAKTKLVKGQLPLLEALARHLAVSLDDAAEIEPTSPQTSLF